MSQVIGFYGEPERPQHFLAADAEHRLLLEAVCLSATGVDVYEEEADLLFEDLSGHVIRDDVFARLLTVPNVLITGHQAFFTHEALTNIAETTIGNITAFASSGRALHGVSVEKIAAPRRQTDPAQCTASEPVSQLRRPNLRLSR